MKKSSELGTTSDLVVVHTLMFSTIFLFLRVCLQGKSLVYFTWVLNFIRFSLQNFKASQRVALILNSVPLIPLLFNVAFVSFSKGLMNTDSANKANRSGETSNAEGSKEEEVDEDDDDSEPLLGRWFEETLSLFPRLVFKTWLKKAKKNINRIINSLQFDWLVNIVFNIGIANQCKLSF